MDPIVTKHGHDWVFIYDDAVQVRARNPTTRFGRPNVEVQITIRPKYNPSGSGKVYWATLGLLSKSGVAEAVRRCNAIADGFPWAVIIDNFCWTMMEILRKPAPLQHGGKVEPDRTKPIYELYPILQKNEPTILYGDSGVGKSLLAVWMGVLVGDGINQCGLEARPGKTLYVDWETTHETFDERVWAVKKGLMHDNLLIDTTYEMPYYRATAPLKDWANVLVDRITEEGVSLVILDSLGMALAGNFNDGEVVVEFFQQLRTLNATSLIIDHQAKGEGSSDRGPIGSAYKKALARSVWELRKVENADNFRVGLFHRKVNRGRPARPFGIDISIAEDEQHNMVAARFSRVDVADDDELAEGLSIYERIYHLLKKGDKPAKEILEILSDVNQNTVRAMLRRRFQQTARGVYGLQAHLEEAPTEQASF